MFKNWSTVQKLLYFFLHICYWKNTPKNIFIFFPEHPIKFIEIYFIHFSLFVPVLYTVKKIPKLSTLHPMLLTKHICTQQIIKSHKTKQTHRCSVLVLSRDFLGNLIPTFSIEPHLVVMSLHLKDYGLSPNPLKP